MNILFEGSNEFAQNAYGGVQLKVKSLYEKLRTHENIKYFDKWNDEIELFDIIHLFAVSHEDWNLVRLAKRKGKKIVVSAIVPNSGKLSIAINLFVGRITPLKTIYTMVRDILHLADVIICETIIEKQFIIDNYHVFADKIVVIPNGISLDFDNIDTVTFYNKFPLNGKFLLQVGRFDENKNQASVIEAMKDSEYQLLLIGGPDKNDPSYFEHCKQIAGNNVIFAGWIRHDDPLLITAYHECYSFILPSHREILGNALFEAASCGANIISTNVLPLDSWGIEKYCQVIDPNDTSSIRNEIVKSFERKKNDTLQNIILRDFSWDSVVEKHLAIYRSIME